MAIPISALVNWYAYLTHPAYSWLKSEILGFWRRELGRPVGHSGVPSGSVQTGEGRELSALKNMTML